MLRRAALAVFLFSGSVWAQDFERLEGPVLVGIPDNPAATVQERLTIPMIGALPTVLRGSRSTPVIVRTDQGNLARLLVAPAFRKPPGEATEPIPIFVLERFETFEMPGALNRLARGRDVSLFDGFQLDLDSGQVVPVGQGGDLQFLAQGEGGPRLVACETARLYTLARSPLPPTAGVGRPAPGRLVVSSDFNGRYRLFANGQWSGALDLTVTDGDVSGRFRSDQTGTSYPVAGQTGSPANRIRFTVTLPRTKLEYDGFLFTEGKGAIAGTTLLLDRPYGFVALREDGAIAPEGDEAPTDAIAVEAPGKVVVELREEDRFRVDGTDRNTEALIEALKAALVEQSSTWVLLRVAAETPYAVVRRALAAIRQAGVDTVRLTLQETSR